MHRYVFPPGIALLLLGAGAAPAQEKEKVDALGDPLPAGAVARLGTTRFRPGGPISRLAYSPDGKQLACWSETGLTVYDAATGRELRHVPLFRARAMTLTWLKDGRGLAVLALDHKSFYVWDFTDPKADPPRIPTPTGYSINSGLDHERFGTFAVSPDGKYLAAGREGLLKKTRTIDLLELVPGKRVSELKLVRTFGPQPGDCTGLAFTHDQRTLLIFSHERFSQEERLVLYDPISAEPRKRMKIPASDPGWNPQDPSIMFEFRHSKPFALAADDRTLAVGAGDGTVRVWDVVRGGETRSITGHVKPAGNHPKGVLRVAFAAGGRSLISLGNGLRTCVWDVGTGRCIREIGRPLGWTPDVAVSPDGKRFATGGYNGQVRVWDAETGAANGAVADYPDVDSTTALAPDGRTVATVGTDGTICLWDLAGGHKRRRIDREHKRAFHLSFTADGKALLAGGYGSKTGLFDAESGKPLPLPGELESEPGGLAGLSPDRRTLLTTHQGVVTLWDWPAGRPRQRFGQADKNFLAEACFSPDGSRLVTDTYNAGGGATELWEAATGRRLRWLNIAEDMSPRAFLPPEGSSLLLVDGCSRGTLPKNGDRWPAQPGLSLWDWGRAQTRLDFDCPPLAGAEGGLYFRAVAFSPDGRVLAVAAGNRPLVLYEVATGQVRRLLAGHRQSATSLRFTPDGRRLLSTSLDRTGLVWDVSLAAAGNPDPPRNAETREQLWRDLADARAKPAYRALARLAATPDAAVALLRERLRPATSPDDAALDRLVADLDAKAFAVRDRATAELDRLGNAAVPGVLARLPKAESLELRRRLEQFLDKHDRGVPPGERLREQRAVELLEHIGTAEARALLRELAGGSPAVHLTHNAVASLRRLERLNQ